MKRVPAFTLVELSVVMLLTAIVTTIAFLTLSILQGSLGKFKKDSDTLIHIELLHRLLSQDMTQSTKVVSNENGIQTIGKKGMATYQFHPQGVWRQKAGLTDSFYFETSMLKKKFQGMEIQLPGQLLDELTFEAYHKKETFTFIFHKIYGADVLIRVEKAQTSNY
jgi:type II secretory pathway pseudopilin PulG